MEGINVNAADNEGDTALTWAAYNGHTIIVRDLLLPRLTRAEISKKNNYHHSAANEAERQGHHELAQLIEAYVSRLPRSPQERLDAIQYVGEIPEEFLCACANDGTIMSDPITVNNGLTFNRESLKQWCDQKLDPDTNTFPCPITRLPLHKDELNYKTTLFVKNAIDKFVGIQEKTFKEKKEVQEVLSGMVKHVEESVSQSFLAPIHNEGVRPPDQPYVDILLPSLVRDASHPLQVIQANMSPEDHAEFDRMVGLRNLADEFIRSFDATFNIPPADNVHEASASSAASKPDRLQIARMRAAFFGLQKPGASQVSAAAAQSASQGLA